jgi:hypothetical protein
MPEFSELLDMLPATHYRSKTGQVLVRIADLMLSYRGNVFTDTQTGRSVNWEDFCSLASAKGLPIEEVEVETGDDGQRWMPLKWLQSHLSLDVFKGVCDALRKLPEVVAVNVTNMIRKDGSRAMFVVVVRPSTGPVKVSRLQWKLLHHPIALCRTAVNSMTKQERGKALFTQDADFQGELFPSFEVVPGDIICPYIDDDAANVILGGYINREYGSVGCFVLRLHEESVEEEEESVEEEEERVEEEEERVMDEEGFVGSKDALANCQGEDGA